MSDDTAPTLEGAIAVAEPAAPKERPLRQRIRLVRKWLGPFARPHRRWLVWGMLGTLFVVACRLSFQWPLRGVLELAFNEQGQGRKIADLVPSAGPAPVYWLAASFVLIALLQGLAELVQRLSFARFSIGTVHDAREAAIEGLAAPQGAEPRDAGDLIARVIGDSARVKAGIKGVLIRMTQNGTFFVGVVIMLSLTYLPLGLTFLAGGCVMLAISIVGGARSSTISRRLRRKEGQLVGMMHQLLSADDDERAAAELDTGHKVSEHAEAKTTKLEGLTIWIVHGTLALTTCCVLVLGLDAVRAGEIAPADMFTVLFYLMLVHNPTVRFARQTLRLGRVLASAERLAKVLKRQARARLEAEQAGRGDDPVSPGAGVPETRPTAGARV